MLEQRAVLDRRGQALPLVALMMFLTMGLAALAIDYGRIKAAGAEAQRAADAAALAGASAFIDYANSDSAIIDSAAYARAIEFATRHTIRNQVIDTADVDVEIYQSERKVRVFVEREAVGTWFASTFGVNSLGVRKKAAAVASPEGVSSSCIKPFLLPDRWFEADKVHQDNSPANGILDTGTDPRDRGEAWFYQPSQGDYYEPFNPTAPSPTQTGYGSGASGLPGDRGLNLLLKPQTGNAQRMGNFYQILDPSAYGVDMPVKDAIANACLEASIGDVAVLKSGSTTSARHGIQDLLEQSPDVEWDDAAGHPTPTPDYPDWTQNPRVIVVALYDPVAIATDCDASKQNDCNNVKPEGEIRFANFARIFLQDDPGNTGNITARFIGFLGAGNTGETTGPLLLVLRLVE